MKITTLNSFIHPPYNHYEKDYGEMFKDLGTNITYKSKRYRKNY